MKFLSHFWLILLASFLAISLGCKPDDEEISTESGIALNFSADTILFDTLFTTLGSTSRRLIVANKNESAINISSIALGGGSNSPYSLIIQGQKGKSYEDQLVFGGDSLLILVEVTVDPNDEDLPFLVRDSIQFLTNGTPQDVKLLAWGQDANFLNDSILACNTVWTADRPYVLTNSVLVDSLCVLRIEKGTRIFSGTSSFIFVLGTLVVEGDIDSRVTFTNDRLEPSFENAPGQWGGIIFLEGSKDNMIDFATIRNAEVGLRVGTPDNDTIPDLVLTNTIVENMLTTGILGFNSDIFASNVLVNNCGEFVVGNFAGGHYTYHHCTFANFPFFFLRQNPAVVFTDNLLLADNSVLTTDMHVNLFNSIIWGTEQEEVLLNNEGGSQFLFTAAFNLVKSGLSDLNINGNILNQDPNFKDPELYNYRLDTLSPAKDSGTDLMIELDLDGTMRDAQPDIGAYERVE